MNNLLELKGRFENRSRKNKPGPSNIPKDNYVSIEKLKYLLKTLTDVLNFWNKEKLEINPLVSVYHNKIMAKSNRIKGIFENSIEMNNNLIVGAKYRIEPVKSHIITYCMEKKILKSAIENLEAVIQIVSKLFENRITYDEIDEINKGKNANFVSNIGNTISKTKFVNTIVDCYFIEKFGIEKEPCEFDSDVIVSLYDTGTKISKILDQLDIGDLNTKSLDQTTLFLTSSQYKILKDKAPYLICMAVSDFSKIECDGTGAENVQVFPIPDPNNEPTIGVIDTLFDENVYFSKRVTFKNMLSPDLPIDSEDYYHGTCVTSIIVDGASINPKLNDGCGRFKVRHFGVAKYSGFSSFTIMKLIKEIIETNKDIKVWNLSLGSYLEINSSFISPVAALLDQIQHENDVIFVVAGTNKMDKSNVRKIGSPADSINSLVVNSVGYDKKPADYSREGDVLSFFNKPDISYYGGTKDNKICVCSNLGQDFVTGTSFSAPWISRKLSYLIDIIGMPREVAKALIIDSATSFNDSNFDKKLIGYGVVPIKIDQILNTEKDEIKFTLSGIAGSFESYNYNIPIPIENGKQPFVAKATLCYFPKCTRNQGVDYTNTELDLYFGRLKANNGTIKIYSIDDNKQSEDNNKINCDEESARKYFRKWDNVKHIQEELLTSKGKKKIPKKIMNNSLWGISIKKKERLNREDGLNLRFGIVITLKEVNGVNRYDDFVQQCKFNGWIVNKVDVNSSLNIYDKANVDVKFD